MINTTIHPPDHKICNIGVAASAGIITNEIAAIINRIVLIV